MNAESFVRAVALAAAAAAVTTAAGGTARASCIDVSTRAVAAKNAAKAAAGAKTGAGTSDEGDLNAVDTRDPSLQFQTLTQEAVKRSAQVGAQQLLTQAAQYDLEEIVGRGGPQGSLNASLGAASWRQTGVEWTSGVQAQGNVLVAGVLYDGGRQQQLTRWRKELARAAQAGFQQAQEQVVLEAVSTALERNRYRMQGQVYQQYVRKMGCLVNVLEQIVAEDRGRASELVQARKSQAQAELARDNAQAIARQLEVRLRKLVGDQATGGDGIGGMLTSVMDAGEALRRLEQGHDFEAYRAQVQASERLADATAAGQKPQVQWVVSGAGGWRGDEKTASAQAGLSLSYNLFDGGAAQSATLAAERRAQAARRQYEEYLNGRVSRVSELHEAVTSSFDRARRYVEVLRDSERVRQATFQQWAQLGRRSLFDVMSAEGDHFNLRVAYVNALYDGYLANAQMRSMGGGLAAGLVASRP